jgi:hypothetical protein
MNMLAELSRIESDSHIKNLETQLRELSKRHMGDLRERKLSEESALAQLRARHEEHVHNLAR